MAPIEKDLINKFINKDEKNGLIISQKVYKN